MAATAAKTYAVPMTLTIFGVLSEDDAMAEARRIAAEVSDKEAGRLAAGEAKGIPSWALDTGLGPELVRGLRVPDVPADALRNGKFISRVVEVEGYGPPTLH